MNSQATSLWPILLAGSVLLLLAGSLHAAPSESQWQSYNRAAVKQHILPRYNRLQASSSELLSVTEQLCNTPTEDQLSTAQSSFRETMAAWQSVQHIQFGPIETLMRNYSMQFWPDKKNLIGKQLNKLLHEQNPESLTRDYLYRASIGVKGLPAMERLLFQSTVEEFADNSFKCQLTEAISGYIAENSKATLAEWHEYYAESIFTAGSDESIYESNQEAAVDMMKSLVEPIEVIRDLKILRPLSTWSKEGKEGKVKPRRLESWRSASSLTNMRNNISSLKHLYSGIDNNLVMLLRSQGATEQARRITEQIGLVEAQLNHIPEPLIDHLNDPVTATKYKTLSDELKILHIQLLEAMQTLEIQLGFNSREGD